jgi:hypothetical protein
VTHCVELLVDLPDYSRPVHGRDPTGFLDLMPAVKVQLGAFPGDVVFSGTAGLGFLTGASRISVPVTIPISGSLGRGRWERLGSQWLFIEFWFTGQKSNAISEATFVVERASGPTRPYLSSMLAIVRTTASRATHQFRRRVSVFRH